MSIYGSIGYTRRDRERERVLKPTERKVLNNLESELRKAQNERDDIYDNMELTDEELDESVKQIQIKIDDLINRVSKIKYEKIW